MRHRPIKYTDTNIIRSILLNINDHEMVCAKDYNVSQEKFLAYINALIEKGIIKQVTEKGISDTSCLCVVDLNEFKSYIDGNIYWKIAKYIIPILSLVVNISK